MRIFAVNVSSSSSGGGGGTTSTDFNALINTPIDTTYILILSSKITRTITGLSIKLGTGSLTASFKINGTSITGLNALSVTTSLQNFTGTALNTMAVSDQLTLVVSSSSTPQYLNFTFEDN